MKKMIRRLYLRGCRRVFVLVCGAILLSGGSLYAFESTGIIRQIDADRGTLLISVNGRDRTVTLAKEIQVLGTDGRPLANGLRSKEVRAGTEVSISVAGGAKNAVVQTIQLGHREETRKAAVNGGGRASVGFKPLCTMGAEDRYKGEDGGLYGGGQNEPPPGHLTAVRIQTEQILPLDAAGNPSKTGRIGLVSISMSNATQEYSRFKQIADADSQKSPQVSIIDCAQGGQAMAEWVNPGARAWIEAERRLVQSGISSQQVQVIWVKLANKSPRGDLDAHGRKLYADTLAVLQNAKARFPNLRIAYLGSRIYGGYSGSALNPEPYAYEGAFVVRRLVQDQIEGRPELQYDGNGAKVPLLLWGPYFWADGTVPRSSDGLVWNREDLAADGTHPSSSGRQKVAEMLLNFFKTDPLASKWFVEHAK